MSIKQKQQQKVKKKEKEFAGFVSRFAAFVVDFLILILISTIVGVAFGLYVQATHVEWNIEVISSIAGMLLNTGYYVFMTYRYEATAGKMAFGLKVKSIQEEKLDIGTVIVREVVGKFISMMLFGLGYLWIIFNRRKQGFHDKLAGTVVVIDKQQSFLKWKAIIVSCLFVLFSFCFFGWLIFGIVEDVLQEEKIGNQIFLQASKMSVSAKLCVSEGNKIEKPLSIQNGGGDVCSQKMEVEWPSLEDGYQYGKIDNEFIFVQKAGIDIIRCEIAKVKCEIIEQKSPKED
jgi:uncharacterized RDD family membrane protein YckC